ncbi:hypothetical protein ACN38_g7146 [Penicillium nordicum]|uniref:Uncharacterized protein n=1 Tax=Penicillium nordicum TaxID=229535 RepID=A0A0M9WEP2_9EURO|nr:hypothetical protein ACN38_g7146 [Penicillium nordicum]
MGVLWEFSPRKRFSFILFLFPNISHHFPLICDQALSYICVQVEADDTHSQRDNKTNGKSRLTQGPKKKKKKEKGKREHPKRK